MTADKKQGWKDKSLRERVMTVIVILVIVVALITLKGLLFGSGADDASSDTLSPEQRIEALVKDGAKKHGGATDEVREVRATEQVDGGYGVFVQFNNNNTASERFLGTTMADIYTSLYTSDLDVRTVAIVATTSLSNPYGDSKEVPVFKTTLDKDTAVKVNFQADEYDLRYTILPGAWTVNTRHEVLED